MLTKVYKNYTGGYKYTQLNSGGYFYFQIPVPFEYSVDPLRETGQPEDLYTHTSVEAVGQGEVNQESVPWVPEVRHRLHESAVVLVGSPCL